MKTTQPYSRTVTFNALDCLEVTIHTQSNPQIDLNKLFSVAVRKNKKRLFLFVSKLLGKHLAVSPYMPRLGGLLLAECFYQKQYQQNLQMEELLECLNEQEQLDNRFNELISKKYPLEEPTLFIGFAETATGLGHSMFSAFEEKATYIHTTREPIVSQQPTFAFQEEHSHATGHECYAKAVDFFNDFNHIVLVDDEITTGNTALNLIKALHEKGGAKHYTVAALLDWRSHEQQQKAKALEQELGIRIEFASLIQGDFSYKLLKEIEGEAFETKELLDEKIVKIGKTQDANDLKHKIEVNSIHLNCGRYSKKIIKGNNCEEQEALYLEETGRFGLSSKEYLLSEQKLSKLGEKLVPYRQGNTTLCMGSEEFIYVPCVIACGMREGIKYQSTTRSPIMTSLREDYPIHSAIAYKRPEDQNVINYLYNIEPGAYEEIFWFFERDVKPEFKAMMADELSEKGIKYLHFVCCDGEKKETL